jgi:gas vesicle protein
MANKSGGTFISGFLIGGAIGAVAAFLMAPQSGEETRMQIRARSDELREQAAARYEEVRERVEATTADLKTRLDALSAKMDQVIVRTRTDLAEQTAKLAQEVAPEEPAQAAASEE